MADSEIYCDPVKVAGRVRSSLAFIDSRKPETAAGLIQSAKTTLRERWKQVERQKGTRALYLTTVDENIAGNAIDDMAAMGIFLVIPESLMKSKESEYAGHKNVLSFRDILRENKDRGIVRVIKRSGFLGHALGVSRQDIKIAWLNAKKSNARPTDRPRSEQIRQSSSDNTSSPTMSHSAASPRHPCTSKRSAR